MFARFACATGLSLILISPAWSQGAAEPTPLIFPVGGESIQVEDSIAGDEMDGFTLSARGGQTMAITMTTDNPSSYFNVYAPGDVPGEDEALFVGSTLGHEASLALPDDGTYLVTTYLMRNAARRDEGAAYSLEVRITGNPEAVANTADPAGAGPDFVRVTGVDGHLNIRSDPATSAEVLTTVENGTRLRNQGCKPVGDESWCELATIGGTPVTGWAMGSFLEGDDDSDADQPAQADQSPATEPPPANPAVSAQRPATAPERLPSSATPPASPAVSADKPAPKPALNGTARGALPCSVQLGMPTRDCAFTVTRQGNGNATLMIEWPNGGSREIRFENGAPVAREDQTTERRGDLSVINLANERYEVPDAVIIGE